MEDIEDTDEDDDMEKLDEEVFLEDMMDGDTSMENSSEEDEDFL